MRSPEAPVTFFLVPHRGATVARPGMTSLPCLSNDPGGGVAELNKTFYQTPVAAAA